jgi:hypothetical protein
VPQEYLQVINSTLVMPGKENILGGSLIVSNPVTFGLLRPSVIRVWVYLVTKVCSLPIKGLIFPLKKDYDRVNSEL